jgi:hypothetical protein
MTENSAIFDIRHGARSSHPVDSPRQRRRLACVSPYSASCFGNFVIPPDVSGQTREQRWHYVINLTLPRLYEMTKNNNRHYADGATALGGGFGE